MLIISGCLELTCLKARKADDTTLTFADTASRRTTRLVIRDLRFSKCKRPSTACALCYLSYTGQTRQEAGRASAMTSP
jgi:hypothetical protein